MKKIIKFNDYLADKLSLVLSIMGTFYVISLLVLIPLFFEPPHTLVAWASYFSCSIFQAIALPVLGYTARKSGNKNDKIMDELLRNTEKTEQLVELLNKKEVEIENELQKDGKKI